MLIDEFRQLTILSGHSWKFSRSASFGYTAKFRLIIISIICLEHIFQAAFVG